MMPIAVKRCDDTNLEPEMSDTYVGFCGRLQRVSM